MPFDDFINGADIAEAATAGWRYVFSRDYRVKKRREWKLDGFLWMLLEIAFGVLGGLLSTAVVGLFAYLAWRWLAG